MGRRSFASCLAVSSLIAASAVPWSGAPAASASGSCAFSDPSGDATEVAIGVTSPGGATNDPALDLVGASARWTGSALELVADVAALPEPPSPPTAATGLSVELELTVAGWRYYAQHVSSTAEQEERWVLGLFDELGRRQLADSRDNDLDGSPDSNLSGQIVRRAAPEADSIVIRIPSVVVDRGVPVFDLGAGDTVHLTRAVTRRDYVAVVPQADQTTGGGCRVSIGGAAPGGLPQATPSGRTAKGVVVAGAAGVCAEGCWQHRFRVTGSGSLTVRIAGASADPVAGATELDLVVVGPAQGGGANPVWETDEPGNGDVRVLSAVPGVYEVRVAPDHAAAAAFEIAYSLR